MRDIRSSEVKVQAHHESIKKLGNWTAARVFEVRSDHGAVALDLRSPAIAAGDIEIKVDLNSSVLKLLVPEGATIDHWNLRGRVKDAYGKPAEGGRVIRLTGDLRRSEVRVYRGGLAIVNAMLSKEYLADARAAWKAGVLPTVDDPARRPA